MLYSARRSGPGGRVHLLVFGGADHLPTRHDRQLLEFAHRELVPLIGSRLATDADLSKRGLSPRRRQILEFAIAGLPEKEIADRLGVQPSTVNEQMQKLYAHFGVHTRARLMAYLLARRPVARPNGTLACVHSTR